MIGQGRVMWLPNCCVWDWREMRAPTGRGEASCLPKRVWGQVDFLRALMQPGMDVEGKFITKSLWNITTDSLHSNAGLPTTYIHQITHTHKLHHTQPTSHTIHTLHIPDGMHKPHHTNIPDYTMNHTIPHTYKYCTQHITSTAFYSIYHIYQIPHTQTSHNI